MFDPLARMGMGHEGTMEKAITGGLQNDNSVSTHCSPFKITRVPIVKYPKGSLDSGTRETSLNPKMGA